MPKQPNTITTTLASAGLTVALTTGLFMATGANAKDDANKITPRIAVPTLNVGGGQFTVKTDLAHYDQTQEPVLTLKAHNPTNQAIEQTVNVTVTSTPAGAAVSRRMVLPKSHWTHAQKVALGPGETKTFELKTGIKLPTGRLVNVMMSNPKQAILAQDLTRRGNARRVFQAKTNDPLALQRLDQRRRIQTKVSEK